MSICAACYAPITWAQTARGRPTPVNPNGTPHWANCPASHRFRTKTEIDDIFCPHCGRVTRHSLAPVANRKLARCNSCRRGRDITTRDIYQPPLFNPADLTTLL